MIRFIRCHAAVLLDNHLQRSIYLFGHLLGISAYVKVRAFLKPGPELGSMLKDAVLYIDFVRLIT
ncbi:hypothetical protein D3C80_1918550 [compost metagenome]